MLLKVAELQFGTIINNLFWEEPHMSLPPIPCVLCGPLSHSSRVECAHGKSKGMPPPKLCDKNPAVLLRCFLVSLYSVSFCLPFSVSFLFGSLFSLFYRCLTFVEATWHCVNKPMWIPNCHETEATGQYKMSKWSSLTCVWIGLEEKPWHYYSLVLKAEV